MLPSFFQKYNISPENTVIIACSWGPDSMYLLVEILKFHPKEKVVVAHFNHSLRWAESAGDENFLKDFSEKNGLIFESETKDIKTIAQSMKKGIEETARIERYAFLERVHHKYESFWKMEFSEKWPHGLNISSIRSGDMWNLNENRALEWTVQNSTENEERRVWVQSSHFAKIPIFTAHHLDDSIETLIFNLIRGTKIQWLTGIAEQNGHILRPLLGTSKTEILKKLTEAGIPYRLDSTNTEDIYLRNHLRLNIVSEFERVNPEYRKNLASFMGYMGELGRFIDTQVEVFLRGESSFKVEDFQILSPFLQREIVRYLYKKANNGTIGLSEGNIAEIIRFMWDKGNYTEKQLGKLCLKKQNFRVYFESNI